jgi:RNA-directed DNA polymerase
VAGNPHNFFAASSTEDVAKLLHVSPGDINHLVSRLSKQYVERTRRKADGSKRKLLVPSEALKLLQRKIAASILNKVPLLSCVYGGVRGKSVPRNARVHVGQDVVFCMDIEQCFPGINPAMVRSIFQELGFGPDACGLLTKLTTWQGQLPQGVPTSTVLANLVLMRIDRRILGLKKIHGFNYTRWVDDLTFSGGMRLLKIRQLLRRIVEDEGFKVNPEKIKTMLAKGRQVVTKLVVNTQVNLPREQRKAIRAAVKTHLATGTGLPTQVEGRMHWLRSVNPLVGEKLNKKVLAQKRQTSQESYK